MAIYDDPAFYIILTNTSIAIGIIGTGVVLIAKVKKWLSNVTTSAIKDVKRDNCETAAGLSSEIELSHKCIQRLEEHMKLTDTVDNRDIDDLRQQLSSIRSILDARNPYFQRLLIQLDEIKDWEIKHDASDTIQFESIKDLLDKIQDTQEP